MAEASVDLAKKKVEREPGVIPHFFQCLLSISTLSQR